jgi:hypothetical protein
LTINLFKVRIGDLTSTDIFVVLVMIDVHCVTLSATLSSKDVLASRSYVGFAILGQTLAWVAVLYTDIRLAGAGAAVEGHSGCVDVPWFDSWISPQRPAKSLPFRHYWISHAYDLIQPSVTAAYHTKRFDKLEKIDREHRAAIGDQDGNQTGYSRLPSTSFSIWRGFVWYPIMLIVVIEGYLSRNGIVVGDFREWGQSFTVITCTCGILHWVYVNLPLMEHLSTCIWHGRWIPRKGPVLPSNIMRLIAIGAHPSLVGEENYKLLVPEARFNNPSIWAADRRRDY